MMVVKLDSYAVEAKFDGINWTNITADVIDTISWKYGILGSGPLDRIGDPGEMFIKLNNTETNSGGIAGYYTPGHPLCRVGFTVGLPVRLVATYDGETRTKFYGTIPSDGIIIQTGRYGKREVEVTVKDWMYQASIHELVLPEFTQNKTIMEVVALILANMIRQPLATDYRTGSETFACVFDTTRTTTRAMSEFAKVALSELGYIYITRRGGDEVLRVEGRYTRNDEVASATALVDATGLKLTTEDGDNIITEDGLDYLITNEVFIPSFDNSMYELTTPYGKELYNRIKTTAYPRVVGVDATTILFSLNSPISLSPGESVTFTGSYRDPTGMYEDVAGTDMQAPIATTDYLMNANNDGTGADLTANLTVVVIYGVTSAVYTLTNTSASTGYVTKLNAVGRGIYTDDPVDYIIEDATSIALVGPSQLTLDMKYQDDPIDIEGIAVLLLERYKDAKVIPDTVSFYANRSAALMSCFMRLEPGDRISQLQEEVSNTNADYYIQGIEASIKPGGFIKFTWFIKDVGFDSFNFAVWDVSTWDQVNSTWGF